MNMSGWDWAGAIVAVFVVAFVISLLIEVWF